MKTDFMNSVKLKTRDKTIRKKKNGLNKNALQLYSLCVIPTLLIFIFNYLPMGGIIIAFKKYRYDLGILGSEWVGFKNFEFFFKSSEFLKITRNTLSLNFAFIVFGIVASLIVALLLFEFKSRTLTKIFQTTLITPHFLSMVIVAYMVYAILNPNYGILNQLLASMGLDKIDWYSKPGAWPAILTTTSVWKNVGMDSVVYYAALMGLDTSYFEAAEIDGANKWRVTWNITLPSLIPLLTILTIVKIGGIFRADIGLFYIVTKDVGTLYPTTDVIDTYVLRTMRVIGDMGMSSAVGLLQSIVGFVLVLVVNKLSKKIDSDNGLF